MDDHGPFLTVGAVFSRAASLGPLLTGIPKVPGMTPHKWLSAKILTLPWTSYASVNQRISAWPAKQTKARNPSQRSKPLETCL